MARKIIKCSRCDETFSSGLDYRWHFDKHIDEWWQAEDGIRDFCLSRGLGDVYKRQPFEYLNEDQWEDFGFANKARQLGYKVNVDSNIVVGHEKSRIL